MLLVGFGLMAFGVIVPFLMVIGEMQPGFPLLFLSYVASMGGLILGLFGAAFYVRERRR
jgi:hypothetical protein